MNDERNTESAPIAAPPAKRGRGGTPGNPGGQPGRSGPPANRNAWKHGGYARLTLSNMPKGLQNVQRVVNELRGGLEAACAEAHGGISPVQAATINSAVWNERLLRLWAKRLAAGYDKLDHDKVALITDRIAKHAAGRDAAIRALDLDHRDTNIWTAVYAADAKAPPLACDVAPGRDGEPQDDSGATHRTTDAVGHALCNLVGPNGRATA